MREAKKPRRNIDKSWWSTVLIPHYKPYKNTRKINNNLTIVFIRLIKQRIIKNCLFFYKKVVVFILVISKKTGTKLIRTMIKNFLRYGSNTELKTC